MKKTFDIAGVKWKLKELFGGKANEEEEGDCEYLRETLTVRMDYGKVPSKEVVLKKRNEALYHEFMHACCYEAGLRDLSWWNEDVEHTIISALQKPLAKNFPYYKKRS